MVEPRVGQVYLTFQTRNTKNAVCVLQVQAFDRVMQGAWCCTVKVACAVLIAERERRRCGRWSAAVAARTSNNCLAVKTPINLLGIV